VTVYLVGAGPGDPGLLTVRGAELLAVADAVVFDRLSAPSLLDLAPRSAERIDVGKTPGGRRTEQSDINDLLVDLGRRHEVVVRLKGGDPFVFARGGEEAEALAAAGVPYEVVPGVTSAIAVPAYAGIPVTLRYSSTSLTIVTGHEDPTKPGASVDWTALARLGGTIVVLMGAARFPAIADALIDGGLDPATPAAAVRWGTRSDQQTIRGTVAELAGQRLEPPVTIVIGEVAARHLDWFERRPLLGRVVVNPRAREQASELTALLRAQGAEVIELAAIELRDPSDGGASLRAAVERLEDYDWVVLTSANGASRFCDAVGDGRRLAGVRLAAIGPGTAQVLERRFLRADLIPPSYVAESLVEAFPLGPGRVLLPRAKVAREELPRGLSAKGWEVEVVEAYETVTATPDGATLARLERADAICFTASSTVTRFLELVGPHRVPPVVVAIGPITAATARDAGLEVTAVAEEHTLDGLVTTLCSVLAP
jgi:uroporphyrinogen III methyltransferase/synthase